MSFCASSVSLSRLSLTGAATELSSQGTRLQGRQPGLGHELTPSIRLQSQVALCVSTPSRVDDPFYVTYRYQDIVSRTTLAFLETGYIITLPSFTYSTIIQQYMYVSHLNSHLPSATSLVGNFAFLPLAAFTARRLCLDDVSSCLPCLLRR